MFERTFHREPNNEKDSSSLRAVWSFWSGPFQAQTHALWNAPLHHLLAWGLSVQKAAKHYPDTVLVTDTPGKKLLIDELGVPFRHVSTELDRLRDVDPAWFSLGKLLANVIQDRPFVHIDADVFLWKPLPRQLSDADVIAQCPEFHLHGPGSPLRRIQNVLQTYNATVPPELKWAWSQEDPLLREENCGIVGGSNVAFLRHYAKTAINVVMDPQNAPAWAAVGDKYPFNWCIEQLFLAASIDYHSTHADSSFRGVGVRYVFDSVNEASDLSRAARAGFTHLWGGAKSVPAVGKRLEERLRREDPAYFRACKQVLAKAERVLPC